MASRFTLVRDRATVFRFESFQSTSILQDEQNLATVESGNLVRKQAVYAWLKPTDMENEQDYLQRIRLAYPETCQWLLEDSTFKEWFDPLCLGITLPKLLWLNGKPGAGEFIRLT